MNMETQPQEIDIEEHMFQVPSLIQNMMGEEEIFQGMPDFSGREDENLAERLSETAPHFLTKLGAKLCEEIEQDLDSRTDWETNIKEKFEQIGLKIEYKSFPFDGASGAYSPLLMQELIKSYAMTISELLPQDGPCKFVIIGEETEELEEQANKIESFFNHYLLNEIPYYPDFEKMVMWVDFSGTVVRKVYFDPMLKKLNSKFVSPYNFVVNYDTSDINTCWRKTEIFQLDRRQIANCMQTGEFIEVDLDSNDEDDAKSPVKMAVEKSEGVTDPHYDKKILQDFYECHVYLNEEELQESDDMQENENEEEEPLAESKFRPYIVKIHRDSKKVVAIHTNWEKDNPDEEKTFYIDYGFIPGFGFYKLGAAHLIGGLSQTSTQLLRQTMDANTLSNFPGGLCAKGINGTKNPDNNLRIGPTEYKEVETGGLPLRDVVMPMPYKDANPMINDLRKDLEGSGSLIMGTATTQMSDFNPNAPVGTTYALLDNILLIQSTITRGLRNSMTREFKLMYKRFSEWMSEEDFTFYRSKGKFQINRNDFDNLISIEPLADPHVTTKMQRLIRAQTIREAALQSPQLYDIYEVEKNFLHAHNLSEYQIELFLPDKKKINELDAMSENQNIMLGVPVKAFIDQDHPSHMITHEQILSMPNATPEMIAQAQAHYFEHMSMQYQIQMQSMMGGIILPDDRSKIPLEQQNQLSQMSAMAIQKFKAEQQQNNPSPPPPLDPSLVLMEKVKVEEQAVIQRGKDTELNTREKAFEAQLDFQSKEEDRKLEREKLELQKIEIEAKIQSGKI